MPNCEPNVQRGEGIRSTREVADGPWGKITPLLGPLPDGAVGRDSCILCMKINLFSQYLYMKLSVSIYASKSAILQSLHTLLH